MNDEQENPIQPVVKAKGDTARFKANQIVRYLIDLTREKGICDMNMLAILPFNKDDRQQFAQLIGYTVEGYGELPYHSEEVYAIASAEANKLRAASSK